MVIGGVLLLSGIPSTAAILTSSAEVTVTASQQDTYHVFAGGACGYESNRVLTEAGTSVYIRNSGITGTAQARYSRLSIREIEP
jgi:hypothetical protein